MAASVRRVCLETVQCKTQKTDLDAFFPLKNKTELVPGKLGVVRFWPIKCQPGPREPDPAGTRRAAVRLPGRRSLPPARRRRPALPPRRPAPHAPPGRAASGAAPAGPFPRTATRYLSGRLGAADLRGTGAPAGGRPPRNRGRCPLPAAPGCPQAPAA